MEGCKMKLNTPTLISDILAKGLLVDIKDQAYTRIMSELLDAFEEQAGVVVREALSNITEDRVAVAMDMYSGGEYKVNVEFKDDSTDRR